MQARQDNWNLGYTTATCLLMVLNVVIIGVTVVTVVALSGMPVIW